MRSWSGSGRRASSSRRKATRGRLPSRQAAVSLSLKDVHERTVDSPPVRHLLLSRPRVGHVSHPPQSRPREAQRNVGPTGVRRGSGSRHLCALRFLYAGPREVRPAGGPRLLRCAAGRGPHGFPGHDRYRGAHPSPAPLSPGDRLHCRRLIPVLARRASLLPVRDLLHRGALRLQQDHAADLGD